jgi:hypothetical protein
MNEEKAKELGAKYLEGARTLCVTSDGGVFVNNSIEVMKKHAKANKLQIFVLKGEESAEAPKVKKKKK